MKKNILLVEHNAEIIDKIKDFLFHEIFDISVAGSQDVAKALLKKKPFDMVITEAMLPKSHGFLLAEYISKNFPHTKIIIIGSKIENTDYQKDARKHGACEYLLKPLEEVTFRSCVSKHLDMKGDFDVQDYPTETTRIHVIPLLDDIRSTGKKDDKPPEDNNTNIIQRNSDSYKIDLD